MTYDAAGPALIKLTVELKEISLLRRNVPTKVAILYDLSEMSWRQQSEKAHSLTLILASAKSEGFILS